MKEIAQSRDGKCLSLEYHGVEKKLEWACSKGHRWLATPHSIINKQSWCPFCSGRRCLPENSLGVLYPNLVSQIHPEKNAYLNVNELSPNSGKSIWWQCSNDIEHAWKTRIAHRVNGSGCPYCAGQRATKENNLATKFPELLGEWDFKKNASIDPSKTLPHARKKVWWICPKNEDHGYQAWIDNRTGKQKSACPYCSGLKVNHTNSLEALYPEIAKQWHPTKNGSLTPSSVSSGNDKKVWWRCERSAEHDWKASIGDRTRGTGCPSCSPQTSLNEIRIFTELETLFPGVRQRFKAHGLEADIFIDELKLAIEYDGSYWHRNEKKVASDLQKNLSLSEHQIIVLRVREKPLEKISEFDLLVEDRPLSKNQLNDIVVTITEIFSLKDDKFFRYIGKQSFAGEKRYNEIVSCLPGPAPEQSLAALNPKIASEFHPTKNSPLTPWHFFPGGGQQVWWLCSKDPKHEWRTTPNSRTYGNYGCPMCSGMMASPTNNLAILHPGLMQEWHPLKNVSYDPCKIKPGSNYKVWWRCTNNIKHEWQAVIANRVNGKQKCPKCYPYFIDEENNFAVKFPAIASEWHPLKNGELKPEEVSAVSPKKVWWLCSKNNDHDWKATVGSRTGLGTGCPICKGRFCEKRESLLIKFPSIAAEWHHIKNGDLPVDRVKPSSSRKVWWQCKKNSNHIWQSKISERVSGQKCPYCK